FVDVDKAEIISVVHEHRIKRLVQCFFKALAFCLCPQARLFPLFSGGDIDVQSPYQSSGSTIVGQDSPSGGNPVYAAVGPYYSEFDVKRASFLDCVVQGRINGILILGMLATLKPLYGCTSRSCWLSIETPHCFVR